MEKETHVYKRVAGLDIHLDVYAPDDLPEGAPTLVWIHGGALIGGDRGDDRSGQFRRYLDAGYRMVSIDYRLAPETKLPEIVADVRDAVDWVRDRGWDRFGAVGHSAGGYLALMAGTFENRPRAIVSFYGYGDIIGDWYSKPDPFYCRQPEVSPEEAYAHYTGPPVTGVSQRPGTGPFYLYCRQNGLWPLEVGGKDPSADPEFFSPYCPEQNVDQAYPPTLLLHGDRDTDVPCEQSEDMAKALADASVPHELIVIRDGGHGFEGGPGETDPQVLRAWDRVLQFLAKHV